MKKSEIGIGYIRYTRRMPKEQYGHEEVEVCLACDDQVDAFPLLRDVKTGTLKLLDWSGEETVSASITDEGAGLPNVTAEDVEEAAPKVEPTPKKKRGRPAKKAAPEPVVEEEEEVEEVVAPATEVAADEEEEDSIEVDVAGEPAKEEEEGVIPEPVPDAFEEEEEEEVVKPKAKAKRSKNTPYDPTIDLHKKIFARELTDMYPDWKAKRENIVRARQYSEEMAGEEFLDDNGKVLQSFNEGIRAKWVATKK